MSSPSTYVLLRSDREAGLKALFDRYAKRMMAYATHHWKTDEDASWDMVYKTMYKVADTIREYEFENEEKFASFVFRIFINYLRNHIRDKKTAMQGNTEVELDEQEIRKIPSETKDTVQSLSLRILQEELEKLEDWQRILMLMRGQEVPYSQIAQLTGRPEGQLKVYYGRIKEKLTQKINEQLKKDELKQHVGNQ